MLIKESTKNLGPKTRVVAKKVPCAKGCGALAVTNGHSTNVLCVDCRRKNEGRTVVSRRMARDEGWTHGKDVEVYAEGKRRGSNA